MNYALTTADDSQEKKDGVLTALRKLLPLMVEEKGRLLLALVAILVNSGLTILAPILLGRAVDHYVVAGQYHGVLVYSGLLLALYLGSMAGGFMQTRIMGAVGQRILFRLRSRLFDKLQELPVTFFNENKAGDLISRINNDTDKLNQFFSRSLMQFVGNIFVVIGAAIAMLVVNPRLGAAALVPALALLVFTQLTGGWIQRLNFRSLQALGSLSGEVSESLENFRVIVAFNRRDYFQRRFAAVNHANYRAALTSDIATATYVPVFGLASNLGTLIVIVYGLSLIGTGNLSFGILISYLAYVIRFYDPLRQMASLWADLQSALAGWDRISEILSLRSNLDILPASGKREGSAVLEFKKVGFGYPSGKQVLREVSLRLEPGKTYALVGPTGGGKTTTASLMARLFDPSEGRILLQGQDIRSYQPAERAERIGFILQDPFLFSGSVAENILYGNATYQDLSTAELEELLQAEGLSSLLSRFDQGLETPVSAAGEAISLGQKQLIAFMRAALHHPDLLILDEATANIDTVTEQLLEEILKRLPATTTRVIIAHRLNTIESADEIFFVNGGGITEAGSLERAVELLASGVRES